MKIVRIRENTQKNALILIMQKTNDAHANDVVSIVADDGATGIFELSPFSELQPCPVHK